MKETVTASVASQSFVFEQDAFTTLGNYLNDIASRIPDEERETLADIEGRIAEIFRERLTSPMMVVTQALVAEAMERMGAPADFGPVRHGAGASGDAAEPEAAEPQPRRLRRSVVNRSIAGVCGGLGEFFEVDPTMIRLLTLLLIIFGGLSIWAYIILWVVIPEEEPRPAGRTGRKA